jgi:septum formation protein
MSNLNLFEPTTDDKTATQADSSIKVADSIPVPDFIFSPLSDPNRRKKGRLNAHGESFVSDISTVVEDNLFHYSMESCTPKLPCPAANLASIILGSSSRSRKEVMEFLGWPFSIRTADIDEKSIRTDNFLELPKLIAFAKADAIVKKMKTDGNDNSTVLITADTIVLFAGRLREKPIDENEAHLFLSSYSNESVSTITAVVATHIPSGRQSCEVDIATVYWKDIPDNIIHKVIAKGNVLQAAGGFCVEDEDLNPLILKIEGSFDSVLGLPVSSTNNLIMNVLKDA